MEYTILLIDDELEICLSLSDVLKAKGYTPLYTTNPLDAPDILDQHEVDLVIMDIKMPEMGGVDLLRMIKKQHGSIPVIMITGYPSVEDTVLAMKYGAVNVYTKPLKPAKMLKEIHELASKYAMKKQYTRKAGYQIVTESAAMQKILKTVEKAALTTAPVFITGESGTGKELVANALHHLSARKHNAFVKVNCAALPDDLLESELFGHERGAFTGAVKERKGRFELAHTGTIFLDEIGDMSLKTQAKILRVIQEQEFERVGGARTIKTDARLIAATNKEMKTLLETEAFREDLYYRLSVITLHLPPLRQRKKDVLALADHFIDHYNEVYTKNIRDISKELRWFLQSHTWPGNVRELKNCIERAVIFCEQEIMGTEDLATQYADLLEAQPTDNASSINTQQYQNVSACLQRSYDETLESLNRDMILNALGQTKGVKTKAADLLNISRRTLYNRMKKLGLE